MRYFVVEDEAVNLAPGDQLRGLGMQGILTLPPEKGGVTEVLCDMDECYRPTGRGHFDPSPHSAPTKEAPAPQWGPTEDHFPKTKEVCGRAVAGNVRLAHRLCNRVVGRINEGERQRAQADKEGWYRLHPPDLAYMESEERWATMRRATEVRNLESVTAYFDEFDAARFASGFWLHVSPVTAGDEILFLWVETTPPSQAPAPSWLPLDQSRRPRLRPGAGWASLADRLRTAGIDLISGTPQVAVAIGPIDPLTPKIQAVQTALAGHLCSRGYRVISEERPPHPFDRGLFSRVRDLLDGPFPARPIGLRLEGSPA